MQLYPNGFKTTGLSIFFLEEMLTLTAAAGLARTHQRNDKHFLSTDAARAPYLQAACMGVYRRISLDSPYLTAW